MLLSPRAGADVVFMVVNSKLNGVYSVSLFPAPGETVIINTGALVPLKAGAVVMIKNANILIYTLYLYFQLLARL